MKIATFTHALFTAFWLTALVAQAGAEPPPMKVFILSGQSNCEGKADGTKLPPEYAAEDPQALLYHRLGNKVWRPLAPYPAYPDQAKNYGTGDKMFGPEIAFGHEMRTRYPDHRIGIIKVTVGGTSVIHWSKDVDSPEATRLLEILKSRPRDTKSPKLYDTLVKDVRDALGTIDGKYEIAGFVWVQTEKDSMKPEAAEAWAGRVLQLHKDLAAEIGYPDSLPLVVMGPHIHVLEKADSPHTAALLAGLQAVAAEGGAVTPERIKSAAKLDAIPEADFKKALGRMRFYGEQGLPQIEGVGIMARGLQAMAEKTPNLSIASSDGLTTHEGLHFDTEGQLELGRRLSRAFPATPINP